MLRRDFLKVSTSMGLWAVVAGSGLLTLANAEAAPQVSGLAVQAASLALKGQYVDAGAAAARSGDAAAIKLVELLYLRDHWKDTGYRRIMDFLNAAPKWPLAETLLKRAEQALYVHGEPAELVLAHFMKRKPVSPEGQLALARSLVMTGRAAEARSLVQMAWANPDLDEGLEGRILSEFSNLMNADDYRRRVWRLIFAQRSQAALRNAKRAGLVEAARVAQALHAGQASGEALYGKLSAALKQQPAMRYALARYYRRKEAYGKARAILVTVPGNAAAMGDAEAFWEERRIIARRSIGPGRAGSYKAAYQISAAHGFKEGPYAVEGEFLAGWIALRYLKDPATAGTHFSQLAAVAPNRTEKARAAYWMGRSLLATGDKSAAKQSFTKAAQFSTVYYGQLAREQIGLGNVPEEIESGASSPQARARVAQDEVVRALTIISKTGNKHLLPIFLQPISQRFDTVDEMNAAASAAHDAGGTTLALRLAKVAAQRNIDIDNWAYPLRGLPDWKTLGKPVERPLVYGLARQESEFDPRAGSRVGAQGLMQLMPATAKIVAKQHGVPYSPAKLLDDPEYNVRLGAAHLADLVADNGGSYVLTLVGYNAGPRRAREWVAEYGDPRGGQSDAIDWVESIPFQETRQYVQKVLQNTHIYRSRLAPETVRPMSQDLKRGTSVTDLTASTTTPEPASISCNAKSITRLLKGCP